LRATALREALEETGLIPDHVAFLSDLAPVDTVTTGFRIYPFLARITLPASWRPQEGEIAEILEVRLRDLADSGAKGEMVTKAPSWQTPQRFPCYRVGHHRIWGATYRILAPLIPRLLAGEWKV
jgi:8-oxo-dGTP pyrophosphatase MutT (NUDIX family)